MIDSDLNPRNYDRNKVALTRLIKELDDITKNPMDEISLGPIGDDLFHWEGVLYGPQDSPYEGGLFKFKVNFTDDYPMCPPIINFITRVYHPNISRRGDICVDILHNKWTSAYTISHVMLSISSLLTDPNPNSPLNPSSAQLYRTNRTEYNRIVREWVKKYANPERL